MSAARNFVSSRPYGFTLLEVIAEQLHRHTAKQAGESPKKRAFSGSLAPSTAADEEENHNWVKGYN